MSEASFTVTFVYIVICFTLIAATVFAYDKFTAWYHNDCKHEFGKWVEAHNSDEVYVQSRHCIHCNKCQLEVVKWRS
jgi:hypothetical protein